MQKQHDMFDYLSKCWRGTKLTVASTQTLASGGVLLHGVLASGGALSIVLGTIGLACSALLLLDSKGDFVIARFVQRNEAALKEYRKQNSDFQRENVALHRNVEQLNKTLDQSAREVASLKSLRAQYVETLAQLENALKDEQSEKDRLVEQVEALYRLREMFKRQHEQFQHDLAEANNTNARITALYADAKKADAVHRAQAERLKTIVDSMQELLAAVAHEGDQFQQFSEAIDTRLLEMDRQNESLEHTAEMMDRLLNQLQKEQFDKLDADGDGVVTASEFESAMLQSNKEK